MEVQSTWISVSFNCEGRARSSFLVIAAFGYCWRLGSITSIPHGMNAR